MNMIPVGDKIIIFPDPSKKESPGGILLPETASGNKSTQGTVVAVGQGKMNDKGERSEIQVKEGDRVIFKTYAGTDVEISDRLFKAMTEEDIIAVIS